MELKVYLEKLDNLFLPLSAKVENGSATEKEVIEYEILKQVYEWSEWIKADKTYEEKRIFSVLERAAELIDK